nr:MAG TPA: hypothetical protein [Caudoviricetes sp.]
MRSKTCRGFNACSGIFISGRLWNEAITLVFENITRSSPLSVLSS